MIRSVFRGAVARDEFLRQARDGGGKGIRTPDLLIANETLYQLSYAPDPSLRPRNPTGALDAEPPRP